VNDDKDLADLQDAPLTREYRRLSVETVPVRLDKKVLRAAAVAARARADRRWSLPFKPLTILASLAVALAVAIQYASVEDSQVGEQRGGIGERVPVQAGGIADPGRTADDGSACQSAQKATRPDWQRCIQKLIETNRLDEAEREQRLLDKTFPE